MVFQRRFIVYNGHNASFGNPPSFPSPAHSSSYQCCFEGNLKPEADIEVEGSGAVGVARVVAVGAAGEPGGERRA